MQWVSARCTESSESEIRKIRHFYPLRCDYFSLSALCLLFGLLCPRRCPVLRTVLPLSYSPFSLHVPYSWTLSHLLLALNQRPIEPTKATTPDPQWHAPFTSHRVIWHQRILSFHPSLSHQPATHLLDLSICAEPLHQRIFAYSQPWETQMHITTLTKLSSPLLLSPNCLNLLPFSHSISLLSLTPLLRKAKVFYELLHFWTIKISRSVGFEGNTPTAVKHLVHDIFAHH